jgi:putative sterol carrier protein
MEIQVIGELNGLAATILPLMEQSIENAGRLEKLTRITGSFVATEKSTGVSITIVFDKGMISLQSDSIPKPSAALWTDFDSLAAYSCGELNAIMGVILGRIKVRGNIPKLLKMVHVLRTD